MKSQQTEFSSLIEKETNLVDIVGVVAVGRAAILIIARIPKRPRRDPSINSSLINTPKSILRSKPLRHIERIRSNIPRTALIIRKQSTIDNTLCLRGRDTDVVSQARDSCGAGRGVADEGRAVIFGVAEDNGDVGDVGVFGAVGGVGRVDDCAVLDYVMDDCG